MSAHDNPRVGNLEDALAHLNIAVFRIAEIRRRLGYTIDPIIERRLLETDTALLTAQHRISAELVQGRKVER